MRVMIRVRKAQAAFGRGDIRFLEPARPAPGGTDSGPTATSAKRAVFAYLRTHQHQTILVVNNLSPEPQVIDLDLEAFQGVQPRDLFTEEERAPIVAAPYRLELKRYGYHWLRL